ncbi:hypothetical protein L195_g025908 [Trifolium pratense]|uniref:Uncharacterized protein n=1 Tax=Trifolium pratense TaxID=57577 RepID=A0A2K3NHS1_TRIPR|nr:hypothetical protein L195_g025908 [Trifolium pratense]
MGFGYFQFCGGSSFWYGVDGGFGSSFVVWCWKLLLPIPLGFFVVHSGVGLHVADSAVVRWCWFAVGRWHLRRGWCGGGCDGSELEVL